MPFVQDQKKSVWFKKQRYHCVYEYPKETPPVDNQADVTTNSEPTSYSDWEEMINEPRLDMYPLNYDDANHAGNDEFFVTSSNRPFQFQTGESRCVSQFFPGANATLLSDERDETDSCQQEPHQNNIDFTNDYDQCQQHQLGELRHTRDRLKLNLVSSNSIPSVPFVPAKQPHAEQLDIKENHELELENVIAQDQCIVTSDDNTLPKVPHEDVQPDSSSTRNFQRDSWETLGTTEK